MRRLITSIAIILALATPVLAGGGADLPGHPLIDARKGKQESRAAVIVPASGATVVTGYQSLAGDGNDDVYTVKYMADGSVVWRAVYDAAGGSDQGMAVTIDKSGDAIVAASVMNAGNYDIYVVRYRDNGTNTPTVVWSRTWSGTAGRADIPQSMGYDPVNDRIYVAGYTNNGSNDDYLLLAFDNTVTGDNPPVWAKTYDAAGTDRAYAVAVSPDGNSIALTGESSNGTDLDLLTVLWDAAGNQLRVWPKSSAGSYNDRGTALAFTSAGNVVATGYLTNGRGDDLYTAELAPGSATPLWEAVYDAGFDDQPAAVIVDPAGDVYVAATAGVLPAFSKLFVVKYHKNGTTVPDTVWSSTYDAGSVNASGASALAVDPAGGVFVAGWRDYAGVKKVVTAKFSRKNGRFLWDREWSGVTGNSSRPVGIGLAGQGVVTAVWTDRTQPLDGGTQAATGGSKTSLQNVAKSWIADQWAGYTLYMASSQNKDIFRRIQGNDATTITLAASQALPYAVASGDLYYLYDKDDIDYGVLRQDKGSLDPPTGLATQVLSNTSVRLSFLDNTETETGFKVDIKIGENGVWSQDAYTIPTPDQAGTGVVTFDVTGLLPDTNYYFRVKAYDGSGNGDLSGEVNAFTRIATFASPALTYIYADPAGGDDQANAVACFGGGSVVVTGTIHADQNGSGNPSKDYYTVKLHRNTFSVLWQDRRDGGYDEDDDAVAVAVDQNLETVMTGTSSQSVAGAGNIPSVWTHKYLFSPTLDGTLEATPAWTDQLNGAGRLSDHADAVAVQGVAPYAVAVAGHGNADLSNIDFYVRKLTATGTVVFTAQNHLGGNEYPAAVSMDAAGNVFVAGRVDLAGNNDWFVAKLDGITGAVLWSDTYGGSGDDRALSLTIDAADDVYVAGYVTDVPTGFTNLAVIKYWGGATGAADRRWIRTYPAGTTAGNSAARKISYDSFDNEIVVSGEVYRGANDRDLALLRYDTAGTLLWERELSRPGTDEVLTGLSLDPSGYIYISGDTGASPNTDIVAAIYTSDGDYVKSFLYNGTAGKDDHAAAIAANKFGEGFVAGYTTSDAGDRNFLALKIVNDLVIMPSSLLAVAEADSSMVDLSWTNVTAGTTPYLKRSIQGSGSWVDPPGTINGKLSADAAFFVDTGLTPSTPYCWRLYAELNSVTTRYTEFCATTALAKPAAPDVTNPSPATTSSLHISWPNIAGNTGYLLERKAGAGGTYAAVATLAANTYAYDDTGLSRATTYYYRLSVQSSAGWSLPSADSAPAYTAPNPVTGWWSYGAPNANQIDLSWVYYTSGDANGYRVERKTGAGGTWSTVGYPASYSFNDSGLTPNTTYYYRVYARYNGVENPAAGPEQSVTTPLGPPTLQSASALTSTTFTATWTQVPGNTGYDLVGKSCTASASIASILANPSTYCWGTIYTATMAADVVSGTGGGTLAPYYRGWYVSARTKSGGTTSVDSNGIVVFPPLAITLSNIDIPASNQLRPVWTDTYEDNFDVQRRPPSGAWTTVATGLTANTLSWIDTAVTDGTQYCYRIRAYTAAGGPAEAWSNELCQTAQAPPAKPSLSLSAPSATTIKLDWNNTNFPTSMNFDVYLSGYQYNAGGLPETYPGYWAGWGLQTTVTCATATCSYTYSAGRGPGIKAFVRTSFYGTIIDSQTVSPADGYVQTMPTPPPIVSTASTDSSLTVTWGRIDQAYSYNIYYKKAADGAWSGPLSSPHSWGPPPYTITGLTPGTQYQVKVESVGKTIESNDAVIKTVWTLTGSPTITGISGVTATQATVSWTLSTGATAYKLERSTDNANWTLVTNQNVSSYPDGGLAAGTTYWYRVKAVNAGGDSTPSVSVSTTTTPATAGVPLLITRSDSRITVGIRLVKGATGYKIYRKDGGSGSNQNLAATINVPYAEWFCGSDISTIACTSPVAKIFDYDDSANLTANTTYCYSVVSFNSSGEAAMGPEYCGGTSPYGPAVLNAVPLSPYKVQFAITPGSGTAPTGYQLEFKQGDNWGVVARIPYGTNSYTLSGVLGAGGSGIFRVRPYKLLADDFSFGINPAIWSQRVIMKDASNLTVLDAQTPPLDFTTSNGNSSIVAANGVVTLSESSSGNGAANSWNSMRLFLADVTPLLGDFDFSTKLSLPAGEVTGNQYHVYARLQFNMPATAGNSARSNFFYIGRYGSTANGYEICWTLDGVGYCNGANADNTSGGLRITRIGRTVTGWVANSAGNGWQPFQSNSEFQAAPGYYGMISQSLARSEAMALVTELDDTVLIGGITSPSNEVTVTMPDYVNGQNSCP